MYSFLYVCNHHPPIPPILSVAVLSLYPGLHTISGGAPGAAQGLPRVIAMYCAAL